MVPRDTSTAPRARERTALACASATIFLGGLGLLGWVTPWRGLASMNPASIPMAPSTALALLLLGGTLILEALRRSPRITTALSMLVLIFACVQLVTFLAGLPPTLDALFVRVPDMFGGVPTGRMSPWTAFGLLLASLSLLLASLSLLFIGLAHGHRALGAAAGSLAHGRERMSGTPLLERRSSLGGARSAPCPWDWGAWATVGFARSPAVSA